MDQVVLYRPTLEELAFRQRILEDPETMAYNHAYGGVVAFPRERWADWYARWVADESGTRFYRYLKAAGIFVGEAAYHYDGDAHEFLCDLIVASAYRRRGYGSAGLRLLCAAAKANGVTRLCDHIAMDNPSAALFKRNGFVEEYRNREYILVAKTL